MMQKKAVILVELLVSIVILTIVTTYSIDFTFKLYEQNAKNFALNMGKMDLESTKLFLLAQKNNGEDITSKLNLIDVTDSEELQDLIYDGALLLDNVKTFKFTKTGTLVNIDICIKRKYEICKKWVIK